MTRTAKRSLFLAASILISGCGQNEARGPDASTQEIISPNDALVGEQRNAVPLDAFFKVDDTNRREGDLIRSAISTSYEIPLGATATRILYRSRDAAGKPSTASAVIVVPEGTPPAGGWPLLVWAHGTTGVARQCGPSAMKSLGYYSDKLMKQGMALLVVDYAGLSTEGPPHQYISVFAHAADIANAVPAARAAVKNTTAEWVAIGHSQGGAAVWGLAELEARNHNPGYLGSIALAPAIGGTGLINNNAMNEGETFYPVFWAFAIKARYPDFDIATMLSPLGVSLYDEATTKGCFSYASARFFDVRPGTVLKEGWEQQPTVRKFLEEIRVGTRPVGGPLFVAAGLQDYGVPRKLIEDAVKSQCKVGGNVFYQPYAGDHGGMMDTSFADQMQWVRDRFSGKPATSNCSPV